MTNQKNGQILQNGQMCFFMASPVQKWPNFSKLAMKWPIWQACKCTFCNFTLWMTHCLGCPGPSPRSSPLCTFMVTTLWKVYRCSKSMRSIAPCNPCMHCERWLPVPLWRNYKMIKSESSQPRYSKSIEMQPWVKPQAGAYCWRQKVRLET